MKIQVFFLFPSHFALMTGKWQIFFFSILLSNILEAQRLPEVGYYQVFESGSRVFLQFELLAGNTCDGIRIFRSADDAAFDPIGEFPGVCGSPIESQVFSFIDEHPVKNKILIYRLDFGQEKGPTSTPLVVYDFGQQGYRLFRQPHSTGYLIRFPNPKAELHRCRLFSLQGSQIWESETFGAEINMVFSGKSPGLYFFELQTVSGTRSGKLVFP
jgi:hypothetical protein